MLTNANRNDPSKKYGTMEYNFLSKIFSILTFHTSAILYAKRNINIAEMFISTKFIHTKEKKILVEYCTKM